MLLGMPKISVSVSDEVHAAVRVRAFREGTSLAELGRRFFEGYGGLAAGEDQRPGESVTQGLVESPRRLPSTPERPPAANPLRKCSREARHHINHSGKPCPECGFPRAA